MCVGVGMDFPSKKELLANHFDNSQTMGEWLRCVRHVSITLIVNGVSVYALCTHLYCGYGCCV